MPRNCFNGDSMLLSEVLCGTATKSSSSSTGAHRFIETSEKIYGKYTSPFKGPARPRYTIRTTKTSSSKQKLKKVTLRRKTQKSFQYNKKRFQQNNRKNHFGVSKESNMR